MGAVICRAELSRVKPISGQSYLAINNPTVWASTTAVYMPATANHLTHCTAAALEI